jgi:bacillithiol biosynthesis deacetylase BshB1
MKLDVLIFAAHPDDAELSMGGTIAKLTHHNHDVGIIDLTRGEMGTRGTAETRQREALKASKILKTKVRENLDIPDGNVQRNKENLLKVIAMMRRYSPKIVFAPYFNDRHPDHIDASKLIKEAMFVSGLQKVVTIDNKKRQKAYRPDKLFYYMQTYTFKPSFIIDISKYFKTKMDAIRAYSTQFYNPKSSDPETFLSDPKFLEYIESRSKFYGFEIRKKYGEAFYCEESIELDLSGYLK